MSGKIPGRPPIPIPKDMLDPRDLPGYQPSPFDVRYPKNPGVTLELGNDDGGRAVSAASEYVSEWCVKLLPPPESVLEVAGGEGYGFRSLLQVRHYGDQFTEYQPIVQPNQNTLRIPLVGVCIGVHGRSIDCRITRIAPGASGKMKLQAAIVPGRPSLSIFNLALSVGGGLAVNNLIAIPTFATRFSIFGQLDAGDIVQMMSASGLGSLLSVTAPVLDGFWPIHPDAAFISYSSAVNKELAVAFEILS